MQWLAQISVRRAVFATVLMLAVLVVGWAGYQGLGVDAFPKIDFPVVMVVTRLDGAAPEEVESEITDKLEEAVNTIAGIDEVQRDARIGRLELRLHDIGPEIEDVLVRRSVPVDPARLGEGQAGQQHHARGGTAYGQHKGTTFHRFSPMFALQGPPAAGRSAPAFRQ